MEHPSVNLGFINALDDRYKVLRDQPNMLAPVRFLKLLFGVSAADRAIHEQRVRNEIELDYQLDREIDGPEAAAAARAAAYRVERLTLHPRR